MVVDILELRGPGGATLRLLTDARGWCQVELATEGSTTALGAETKRIVTERLLTGLTDSLTGKSAGQIHGVTVRWVMSLSERHCSVYAGDVGTDRHLFFQASGGELLATVVLSEQQRYNWLRELQRQ